MIPLIILGISIVTAGYGAKKALDAYEDNERAKFLNEKADRIIANAEEKLEKERENLKAKLEEFGMKKLNIFQNRLIPFKETVKRIKTVEYTGIDNIIRQNNLLKGFSIDQINSDIELFSVKFKDIFVGSCTGSVAGGLMAFGAYGTASLFGTASTGTAISALKGVAARNATLAWLGGGAKAAGGFGILGGQLLLAASFGAPIIACVGQILASKAKAKKLEAEAKLKEAEAFVEKVNMFSYVKEVISRKIDEVIFILDRLLYYFDLLFPGVKRLEAEMQKSAGLQISEDDKKGLAMIYAVVGTIFNLLKVDIITEEGGLAPNIDKEIKCAREFLSRLD